MTDLWKVWLKRVVGYDVPRRYWDFRAKNEVDVSDGVKGLFFEIKRLMRDHYCFSVLDVGCGVGFLRELDGYLGLDFSSEVLCKSNLDRYVFCDVTQGLPFGYKSFDCVVVANVLVHVKPDKVRFVVSEVCRVAKNLVVVVGPGRFVESQVHCFDHDIKGLFDEFGVEIKVVYL